MLVECKYYLKIDERVPLEIILAADKSIKASGRVVSCIPDNYKEPEHYNIYRDRISGYTGERPGKIK